MAALQKGHGTLIDMTALLQLAGQVGRWIGRYRHLVVVCPPYLEVVLSLSWQPVPAGYESDVGVVVGGVIGKHCAAAAAEAPC